MSRLIVGTCAVLTAGLVGCETSGLSAREVPGRDHGTYVRAMYDRPVETDENAPPARPFVGPAKVAVVQVGEVAPDATLVEKLRKASGTFTRVEAISDAGGDTFVQRRDPYNHDAPLDNAKQRLQILTNLSRDMGMDYMLLVGGSVESQKNATPLSILNLTIIGAFIIPSDQTRALAKATGYMVDVHSGRVVAVSSAEAQDDQLTPAISTDAENVVFLRKLRGEVTAKLADQVVIDCKGKTAVTASAQ